MSSCSTKPPRPAIRAAGPARSASSKPWSPDCVLSDCGEQDMKLYYSETLNPRKVCAVAKYLNAPVEFVHVDLRQGEQRKPPFLAINPNGKVPALEDGDTKLWESNAIMAYLAHAAGSDLWPRD